MSRILVIEDDPDIALSIKYALERGQEHSVVLAHDGQRGLRAARAEPPHLVILDLNLPGIDGFDVCRALRADPDTAEVPIIMVTARIDEADTVAGLELGADDYLTKPFSIKELLARVRALLRRAGSGHAVATRLTSGPLVVDEERREAQIDGRVVALTRKEFDLLVALLRQSGRVLTRDRLLETVWGYDHPGATRTVDVHVRQLRRKLGPAAAACIETVVGVGYRFRAAEEPR